MKNDKQPSHQDLKAFEDRTYLKKEDLQQIKVMGLKFRGANAYPLFRNYAPGFVP
jgi:hypothetical protein